MTGYHDLRRYHLWVYSIPAIAGHAWVYDVIDNQARQGQQIVVGGAAPEWREALDNGLAHLARLYGRRRP